METKKRGLKRSRKGYVLPLAIAIALCLALLGIGLLQLGLGSRVNAALTTAGISSRAAADAGITDALYKMNAALNFDGTINWALWPGPAVEVPLANSKTNFSYEIFDRGTYWEVISTGRINRTDRAYLQEKTVHTISRRQSYWFGVGVQDTFTVHNNATFGTIPPGSTFDGSVRTNSVANDAITIQTSNPIPGDVAYGPGGEEDVVIKTPGKEPSEVIEGSIYDTDNTLAFPDAELPDNVVWQAGPVLAEADYVETGEIDGATGLPIRRATLISGPAGVAYKYDGDLTLPTFGGDFVWELRLIGAFVINVTRDMIIPGNTRLVIGDLDPAFIDNVELYLGSSGPVSPSNRSSLDVKNGSAIMTLPRTPGELPHSLDLKIYGLPTCSSGGNSPDITIYNSSEFWGVIYAPSARLDIRNSGNMYGGFVGYSIDLYSNGGFYYDSRIPLEYNEGPLFFEIHRWWETRPLSNVPL